MPLKEDPVSHYNVRLCASVYVHSTRKYNLWHDLNATLVNPSFVIKNLPLCCTLHMPWVPWMLWNLIICLVCWLVKPDDHVVTCWISGLRCSFVDEQWRVICVLANLPHMLCVGDPQKDTQICRLKLNTEMKRTCLEFYHLKANVYLKGCLQVAKEPIKIDSLCSDLELQNSVSFLGFVLGN